MIQFRVHEDPVQFQCLAFGYPGSFALLMHTDECAQRRLNCSLRGTCTSYRMLRTSVLYESRLCFQYCRGRVHFNILGDHATPACQSSSICILRVAICKGPDSTASQFRAKQIHKAIQARISRCHSQAQRILYVHAVGLCCRILIEHATTHVCGWPTLLAQWFLHAYIYVCCKCVPFDSACLMGVESCSAKWRWRVCYYCSPDDEGASPTCMQVLAGMEPTAATYALIDMDKAAQISMFNQLPASSASSILQNLEVEYVPHP